MDKVKKDKIINMIDFLIEHTAIGDPDDEVELNVLAELKEEITKIS